MRNFESPIVKSLIDLVNSLSCVNFSKSSLISSILVEIDLAALIVNLMSLRVSLSSIDDEETLKDIKFTINAARSISGKLDNMSDDFEKLTQDKELTKSIRDLTIGLSKFLNEIYP